MTKSNVKSHDPKFTGWMFMGVAAIFFVVGFLPMRFVFEGTPQLVLWALPLMAIGMIALGVKYLLDAKADSRALT